MSKSTVFIIIIVIAVVIIGGVVAFEHYHGTNSVSNKNWQTYQDKTYQFSFKYPGNWEAWPQNTDSQIQINAPASTQQGDYVLNANIVTSFFTAPKTASTDMNVWLTYESSLLQNAAGTTKEAGLKIAGQSATHFQTKVSQDGQSTQFIDSYLFVKGNAGYYITVDSKQSPDEATSNAILSSFKFSK